MVSLGKSSMYFREIMILNTCAYFPISIYLHPSPCCMYTYVYIIPPPFAFRIIQYITASYGIEDFFQEIVKFGAGTFIIGAVQMVMGYIFVASMNYAAEGQVRFRTLGPD